MKRKFTLSGLVLLLTFFVSTVFAQNITVTGKVTDANTGEALLGVSVGVKSTGVGAQTGPDGTFKLSVPNNTVLTFSYIGYTAQNVTVTGAPLNVKLAPAAEQLQQVVVVGYGTQRKVDVTGSVASVKGEDIAKQSSPNAVAGLQGKVAGVNIVNSGSPGASPQVTIRGTGTLYGNTNVLYVVDGVWYSDISFLNPQDIDNISVLKDASSTAIYGIRASNGVIIITTKKGKKGQVSINYNGYAGVQNITHQVKMANATEYATLINELTAINGASPLFTNVGSLGTGTDWYKQILRSAFTMNHQVSVNGGTDKSDYNVSLGMLDQDGNVKNNNYKRYTFSLNNNYHPVKNLDFGIKVNGTYSRTADYNSAIFTQLYGAAPVLPVYNADGSYGDPSNLNLGSGNNNISLGGGNKYNPQVTLDYTNINKQQFNFNGNIYAQLTFLKDFKFKTSFGGSFINDQTDNYTPVYKATTSQLATVSSLSRFRGETRNWIVENTLTYDKQFGDHKLTVLLGQTAQREQYYAATMSAQGVPAGAENSYFGLASSGTYNIVDTDPNNPSKLNTFASYFGRVNYAFKDKYLLNASIRRDGASQFYGTGTYTNLPAVGAGWVISNEDFMKDQHLFQTLKLRGSWGRVANAGVPFNITIPATTTSASYTAIFGNPQTGYAGTSIATVIPPLITIERSSGTDVGLEGTMLDSHLNFEIDYYNRSTDNAVFRINIPGTVGTQTSTILGNQAKVTNQGFEAVVGWRSNQQKAFTYSISANVGYNKNKVVSVVTGINPIYAGGTNIANGALATRTVQGEPIGEFYGYKVAGIFQTAAEVNASAQPNAKPGDFKYVDTNGDGIIDGRDRVVLGNPNPKYNYGVNTTFGYKNFDLSIDMQGVAGVDVYNTNLAYRFGNENFTQDFYNNRWHGAGTSNTYPSAAIGSTANAAPNSFYVSSGSYFRVRNLQLGYTLPQNVITKWKASRLRIYANAQNAINIFGYKGFSPEVGGTPTNAGLDANVYPLFATYNLGVNVSF